MLCGSIFATQRASGAGGPLCAVIAPLFVSMSRGIIFAFIGFSFVGVFRREVKEGKPFGVLMTTIVVHVVYMLLLYVAIWGRP